MLPITNNKKFVFFWGDGMGETTNMSTSLEKAITPNMDILFQNATSGFFLPVLQPTSSTPKTDIVIPYMFYITPDQHFGRVALDLIDSGVQIPIGAWVGSFRLVFENASKSALPICFANSLIKSMRSASGTNVYLCPTSSHNNIFAIICSDVFEVKLGIKMISEQFEHTRIKLKQIEIHQVKHINSPIKKDLYFVGWAKGSLRGMFRLIGSGVNEFTPKRYCFEEYFSNLNMLQNTNLKSIINSYDILVFFIKETDSASHLGDQNLKVKAIETLDWVIGQMIPMLPTDSRIIVLADHPTDIGSPTSIAAPTPFMFTDLSKIETVSKLKFCESNISYNTHFQTPLSMEELRATIFLER